jgi:hypothetical protein
MCRDKRTKKRFPEYCGDHRSQIQTLGWVTFEAVLDTRGGMGGRSAFKISWCIADTHKSLSTGQLPVHGFEIVRRTR